MLLEFALVAPLIFTLIFGLITGTFMVFQDQAVHDAAIAGTRIAVSESPLLDTSNCEFGTSLNGASTNYTIVKAVTHAATIVPVDQNQLCATGSIYASGTAYCNGSGTPVISGSALVQVAQSGRAQIVVTATPNLAYAQVITVLVCYSETPLTHIGIFPIPINGSSTLPVLT